jgi:hypothetical protein
MEYLKRIADEQLRLRLEAFGAVQIKGPKWCGKTTTALMQAKSVIKMQNPDTREGYLATARTKPSVLLKGETPRLIDEWQVAPMLFEAALGIDAEPLIGMQADYDMRITRKNKSFSERLANIRKVTAIF